MKSRQAGFTMIELIVVIVILGILAATALPKFIDMREEAQQAAVDGVAGAAASAMTLNYSGCSLKNNVAGDKCVQVNNCQDVASLLQGGLPDGYTVGDLAIASNGAVATNCTVTGENSKTATFTGIGAAI